MFIVFKDIDDDKLLILTYTNPNGTTTSPVQVDDQ